MIFINIREDTWKFAFVPDTDFLPTARCSAYISYSSRHCLSKMRSYFITIKLWWIYNYKMGNN